MFFRETFNQKMSYLQGNPRWNNRLQCYVTRKNIPIVYVDGSTRNNGYPNAVSGVGVWLSDDEGYT